MYSKLVKYGALTAAVLLASCNSIGERTVFSVGYYTVNGDTFEEVDNQIELHGPNVAGVGKALASTDLQMQPVISYAAFSGGCRVDSARVNVRAKVTLPRHANIRRVKREVARAWTSLEEYARAHEAVHLAIADNYALKMEDTITALKPENDCSRMRRTVSEAFSILFEEHHKEQLQFDQDEKERIQNIAKQSRNQAIPRKKS